MVRKKQSEMRWFPEKRAPITTVQRITVLVRRRRNVVAFEGGWVLGEADSMGWFDMQGRDYRALRIWKIQKNRCRKKRIAAGSSAADDLAAGLKISPAVSSSGRLGGSRLKTDWRGSRGRRLIVRMRIGSHALLTGICRRLKGFQLFALAH